MNELYRLLKAIEPIWQAQIDFIKQTDDIIVKDPKNIKILSDILKEEGDILKMEENLLRKIDLKTGTILRKATLKERDIERTKSLDLNYREVQHVR